MTQHEGVVLQIRTCCRCGIHMRTQSARVCSRCLNAPSAKRASGSGALTHREAQISFLVGQAKLNKEIAFDLRLTEGTIKEYLHRIFRKVGAKNRTELAIWALRNKVTASIQPQPIAGQNAGKAPHPVMAFRA